MKIDPFREVIMRLKDLFKKKPAEPLSPLGDRREKEHRSGWIIWKGDRELARLNFKRIDPPFYLFGIEIISSDESLLSLLTSSAKREPLPDLFFENIESGLRVEDKDFLVNQHDTAASIRDMRLQ